MPDRVLSGGHGLRITPADSGFSGVSIHSVPTIPLPAADGPRNPVAGESPARVTAAPPAVEGVKLPHRDRPHVQSGSPISSPVFEVPSTGPTLSENSPFGQQFAAYARLIQEDVARVWNPGESVAAMQAVVRFTILRDGSVSNVKVVETSGDIALDHSAERAAGDARFPAFPAGFPRTHADVELRFVVRK